MQIPEFKLAHRLSEWPCSSIELHCCKGTHSVSTSSLLKRCGDITFEELLPRFRCNRCHRFRPAPVFLCADRGLMRDLADWRIELVPPIREKARISPANQTEEERPAVAHTSWSGGFF